MKKKTKYSPDITWFDTNATYSIPLVKEGIIRHVDNEERVSGCHIEQDKKGNVIVKVDGYQMKLFMDKYFDWLLYTGYVIKEKR